MGHSFYAKILLFGEYAALKGSSALAIPFMKYKGSLDFAKKSNLLDFFYYLKDKNYLNIDELRRDIDKGLIFKSTIPIGQGLGSSAALVSAIFYKYGKNHNDASLKLKDMETYFHKISSGVDPSTSFFNTSILYKQGIYKQVCLPKHDLLLWNSQNQGIVTSNLINIIEEKLKVNVYSNKFKEYQRLSDLIVDEFISGRDYTSLFKQISLIQFDIFKDLISKDVKDLWKNGLSTNEYYLKLCGSGGTYFLGIGERLKSWKDCDKLRE